MIWTKSTSRIPFDRLGFNDDFKSICAMLLLSKWNTVCFWPWIKFHPFREIKRAEKSIHQVNSSRNGNLTLIRLNWWTAFICPIRSSVTPLKIIKSEHYHGVWRMCLTLYTECTYIWFPKSGFDSRKFLVIIAIIKS